MADLIKRLQLSEKQYGVGLEENPFSDKSPTECMTLNFGGGGSPPPPPPMQSSQTVSNIPEYFQPYLERLFERGEAVTTEPFQRYEGQRLAEFTPEQQTAFAGVKDVSESYQPYLQASTALTGTAATQSTDPNAIASRMSPYQQAVIDIQKREALRDANKIQQQIGASAVGVGAFGGSRQALQETELARQLGQRTADIQATGSQQAFNVAQQNLAADRAAALASGQQYGQLGAQSQQLGLSGLGAQEAVGQAQQAQKQKALDIGYEDFARETTLPSQQVQEMSSILRGFNLPTSTYKSDALYQAPPSTGQQLMSAGLGVYGLGAKTGLFAEGGEVNPGIKALAKESPETVTKMGYDPQEVLNAYIGGRMSFQGGGSSPIGGSSSIQDRNIFDEKISILNQEKQDKRTARNKRMREDMAEDKRILEERRAKANPSNSLFNEDKLDENIEDVITGDQTGDQTGGQTGKGNTKVTPLKYSILDQIGKDNFNLGSVTKDEFEKAYGPKETNYSDAALAASEAILQNPEMGNFNAIIRGVQAAGKTLGKDETEAEKLERDRLGARVGFQKGEADIEKTRAEAEYYRKRDPYMTNLLTELELVQKSLLDVKNLDSNSTQRLLLKAEQIRSEIDKHKLSKVRTLPSQ